jgi:hypothetical protein
MSVILPILFQYGLPSTMVAVIGGWFLLAGKRRDKASSDAAAEAARLAKQFPGWQELVDENRRLRTDLNATDGKLNELDDKITELRRNDRHKMHAVARILRALHDQWPSDNPPNLDPADIAAIEDTVPPAWIRRRA